MPETEVFLLRYDISHGQAAMIYGPMLGMSMEAIWHTSLMVYGSEYLFDGGSGIVRTVPKTTPFGQPLREESLGMTTKTQAEFEAFNEEKRIERFGGTHYELLNNNCNHYTNEASVFLTGEGTPDDVVNMIPNMIKSPVGALLSPLLTPLVQGVMDKRAQVEEDRRAGGASEAEVTDGGQNFPKKIPETDDRAREGPNGYGPTPMGSGVAGLFNQFLYNGTPEDGTETGSPGQDGTTRSARPQRGESSTVIEEVEATDSSPSHGGRHHAKKSCADVDDVEDVILPNVSTVGGSRPPAGSNVEDVVVSPKGVAHERPTNASSNEAPLAEMKRLLGLAKAANRRNPANVVTALQSYCHIARVCGSGQTPETPVYLNRHPLGFVGPEAQGHRWLALLGYHISPDKITASFHPAYRTGTTQIESLYDFAAEELEELETEIMIQQSMTEQ